MDEKQLRKKRYNDTYTAKHKISHNSKMKEYYHQNKDVVLKKKKDYYSENKKEILERTNLYNYYKRLDNPEYFWKALRNIYSSIP